MDQTILDSIKTTKRKEKDFSDEIIIYRHSRVINDSSDENSGKNSILAGIHNWFNGNAIEEGKKLWALWGKVPKSDEWVCVQVGSGNDICKEICDIVGIMCSEKKTVWKSGIFFSGEEFYKYETYSDNASCKYREMNRFFEEFLWIKIEENKYANDKYDAINYAEVKYAIDNTSLLWNPAPSTYGNQEKSILAELQAGNN